jgi:hypothetical protein
MDTVVPHQLSARPRLRLASLPCPYFKVGTKIQFPYLNMLLRMPYHNTLVTQTVGIKTRNFTPLRPNMRISNRNQPLGLTMKVS